MNFSLNLARIRHLLLFCLFLSPGATFGFNTTGRITVGTYFAQEKLAEPSAGDYTNNLSTYSGRFFLRATEIGALKLESVTDIRDKHDFFGLVDRERLQLTDKNTLQIRQVSLKYPGPVFYTQIGRFPVPEAGAVYTDGLLQGANLNSWLRFSLFGGLNPKRPEQTYVQYNSDSQNYGAYLSAVPILVGSGRSFSLDSAGVVNTVSGATDRTYWYNNLVYQWQPANRISLMTYLDFVPNTYLQNGTLNYTQNISRPFQFALTLLHIDVIEYMRLQSVRSQLPSSPYQEGNLRFRIIGSDSWSITPSLIAGKRNVDGLEKKEILLTNDFTRIFNKHWDAALTLGYSDGFASKDQIAEFRISYYSDTWEIGLDEQYSVENYKTNSLSYHPLITEFNLSKTFNKSLYAVVSLQDVRDERVQITSGFFKLSYRFGSNEIPPIRDGAPPRLRL